MRKKLRFSGVCLLGMMLFAGCSSQPAKTVTDAAEPGSSKAGEAAVEAAFGEKIKVEFLQGKAESVAAYDAVINQFNQAEQGIMVEQNNVPDAYTVLTTRLNSGDYPDIFNHFPLRPDFAVLAESKKLSALTGEAFLERVNPDILAMTKQEDGEYYALPLTINTMGIYLNNDILERLGETVPETYQELIALLEKAKDEPDGAFLFPCRDAWTLAQLMDRRMGQLFMNSGRDFAATFAELGAGTLKSKDVPEITGAVEKILEVYQYAQEDPFGAGFTQICDDFANGKALGFFQGTWAYANIIKANPDLDFCFVPFPADEGQTSYLSMNIDIGLCIPAGSRNQEQAKAFLDYISQAEHAQVFNDIDGSMSTIQGVKNNVLQFEPVFQEIQGGAVYEMMSNYWPNGFNTRLEELVSGLLLEEDAEAFYEALDQLSVEMYNQ